MEYYIKNHINIHRKKSDEQICKNKQKTQKRKVVF